LSGSSVLCWLQQKTVEEGKGKRRGGGNEEKNGTGRDRTGRDETEWRGKLGAQGPLGQTKGGRAPPGVGELAGRRGNSRMSKGGKEEEKRRRKNEGYKEKMREKPKPRGRQNPQLFPPFVREWGKEKKAK
jgi:hypothetical protein